MEELGISASHQSPRVNKFLIFLHEGRTFGTLKLKTEEIFLFLRLTCIHFAFHTTFHVIIRKNVVYEGFKCNCTRAVLLTWANLRETKDSFPQQQCVYRPGPSECLEGTGVSFMDFADVKPIFWKEECYLLG
jgi:hypothetical protein